MPCRAEKDWHPGVRGVGCSGRFCPSGKRVVGFCCQLLTACLGLDISNSNQIKMYVQFSSVAQSCLTLCDPMGCSMPGLPVHHQLPQCTQLMSMELVMPSNQLILCHPLLLLPLISPSMRVFSNESAFASGGQGISVSTSTSVLPMNTQD